MLCFSLPFLFRRPLSSHLIRATSTSFLSSRLPRSSQASSARFFASMKAIYQDASSGTDFKYGEMPDPTAGSGEVLVRIHAASTNPVDFKRYLFGSDVVFPTVAGHDIAGVVEAVGEGDVSGLVVGDRVFGCVTAEVPAPKTTGAFAELAAVPAGQMAKIPEGLRFEEMAALPIAVGTPMQAFAELGVSKGDKVFISGGAGGVGIHAMQLAKYVYEAGEVSTTASPPKFQFVKDHGADTVVDYRSEDAGVVLKNWADYGLDLTGEPVLVDKTLKDGGSAKSIVEFDGKIVPFMMVKPSKELMEKCAAALKDGKFKVVIDKVYKLEDGVEAIKYQAGGRAKGKVVIKMI